MSGAAGPEYELIYWPVHAVGEPIRMCMTLGGITFKDTTPKTDEKFAERKEALAPRQLPVLLVEGTAMDQSTAILRYLGKICKYEGKPLYPEDPLEAFWCDNLIMLIDDMQAPVRATFAIQDQAEKEAARAALFEDDGKITKYLGIVNDRLASRVGQTLTIGDIYAFCITNILRQPTFIDGIPAGKLDKYENITKFHEHIANLPPILEYYKNADGIRATFKPFS